MIARDIEAGVPVNPDGTINLVHYAAWLVTRRRQSAFAEASADKGYGGQEERALGD
jgi:hypothetical protein